MNAERKVPKVLELLEEYAALVGDDHDAGVCNCEIQSVYYAMAEFIAAATDCLNHGGHEVVSPGVAAARVARLRAAVSRLQGESRA